MSNNTYDLVTVTNTTDALAVFGKDNVSKMLADLENEVNSVVPDLSTAKGRKEITSLAYKVSQSKTALDGLGKDLVADWKEKAKAVDSERKVIRERLDALRDTVKAPLIEWQRVVDEKIAKVTLENEILEAHELALDENTLFDRELTIARKEAQAELEAEAQRQKEESQRIEQERVEREALLVEEAEQRAIRNAEQQVKDAKASEERAIRERAEAATAAEEKRILDIKNAEERIRQTNAKIEQERIHKIKLEEQQAATKAADKDHRANIDRGIFDGLVELGAPEEFAKDIITIISEGRIPNVTINY
ncbi:MAG: hypothetical protein PF440_11470 [Thiomicrorhabdus sp.]|nr:hypothetical protein [Thiomicrorhabdus sp.]